MITPRSRHKRPGPNLQPTQPQGGDTLDDLRHRAKDIARDTVGCTKLKPASSRTRACTRWSAISKESAASRVSDMRSAHFGTGSQKGRLSRSATSEPMSFMVAISGAVRLIGPPRRWSITHRNARTSSIREIHGICCWPSPSGPLTHNFVRGISGFNRASRWMIEDVRHLATVVTSSDWRASSSHARQIDARYVSPLLDSSSSSSPGRSPKKTHGRSGHKLRRTLPDLRQCLSNSVGGIHTRMQQRLTVPFRPREGRDARAVQCDNGSGTLEHARVKRG